MAGGEIWRVKTAVTGHYARNIILLVDMLDPLWRSTYVTIRDRKYGTAWRNSAPAMTTGKEVGQKKISRQAAQSRWYISVICGIR